MVGWVVCGRLDGRAGWCGVGRGEWWTLFLLVNLSVYVYPSISLFVGTYSCRYVGKPVVMSACRNVSRNEWRNVLLTFNLSPVGMPVCTDLSVGRYACR